MKYNDARRWQKLERATIIFTYVCWRDEKSAARNRREQKDYMAVEKTGTLEVSRVVFMKWLTDREQEFSEPLAQWQLLTGARWRHIDARLASSRARRSAEGDHAGIDRHLTSGYTDSWSARAPGGWSVDWDQIRLMLTEGCNLHSQFWCSVSTPFCCMTVCRPLIAQIDRSTYFHFVFPIFKLPREHRYRGFKKNNNKDICIAP